MKHLVTYILESQLNYKLGYILASEDARDVLRSQELEKWAEKNGYDYVLLPNIREIADHFKDDIEVDGEKWIIVKTTIDDKIIDEFNMIIPCLANANDNKSLLYRDVVKEWKNNKELRNDFLNTI